MSIATEITNLAANRDAIKAAIEAKNPATAPTSALSSFPAAIASIPTGGGGDGWVKPDFWPDIEAILAADVTPQAAVTAGATKKWIMLCNPGPPGGGSSAYTFRNGSNDYCPVYVRVSDGTQTYEQAMSSSAVVEPLDNGKPFWIIVYTAGVDTRVPGPCFAPYNFSGQLWVHAPEHVFHDKSHDMGGWRALARFVARGVEISTYNAMFYETASVRSFVLETPPVFVSSSGATAFFNYTKLRRIDVSGWNFSPCTSFSGMFNGCSALAELKIPEKMVGTSVTDLQSMFNGCSSLAALDLSDWDVSNVTNMYNMFNGCYSLSRLDLSGWDTAKLNGNGPRGMFAYTYALRSVDTSTWRMPLATSAIQMFVTSGVVSLDLCNLFATSACTTVDSIFNGCYHLATLDISGWDCGTITNWNNAFSACGSLETIIGAKTVSADGSVGGSTAYFGKGPKVSFKLNDSPLLGHDSLLYLMYWVPSVSGQTMTLGATNLAKLTADEKAVATAKGWTLA